MSQVMKFGGAAMANAKTISKVADIIESTPQSDGSILVVVSALYGVTNSLEHCCELALEGKYEYNEIEKITATHLQTAAEILDKNDIDSFGKFCQEKLEKTHEILQSIQTLSEITIRSHDQVITVGEFLSSYMLQLALKKIKKPSELLNPLDFIRLETKHGLKFPDLEKSRKLYQILNKKNGIKIIPGFIGKNTEEQLETLGRGGSDLSATVCAFCCDAKLVTLFKEVDGLLTADPRIVPEARIVDQMHYREATELAYYGAKILHPRTIIPLVEKNIPLHIKNFNSPQEFGTLIKGELSPGEFPVKALTAVKHQCIVSIEGNGMMGVPGIASRTFASMAEKDISVTLISQASSESSICFTINENDKDVALKVLNEAFEFEVTKGLIARISSLPSKAVIALVGMGMDGTKGIASRAFKALANSQVNIQAIAQGSTELNISLVIDEHQIEKGLRALHREFRLEKFRTIKSSAKGSVSLSIYGYGQIAQTLMGQLKQQSPYFKDKLGIQTDVVSVSDSSALLHKNEPFHFDELTMLTKLKKKGLKLKEALQFELNSDPREGLRKCIFNQAFRSGVLVDLTAAETAPIILEALTDKMNVVLANKKPLAIPIADFQNLIEKAQSSGVQLKYEATVGAGLPVLDTISKLKEVGDEIIEIKGCFSGTLGYIFSSLENGKSFSSIVESAYMNGYTEPDPRDDLSGVDVARKALILARTLGLTFNFEDISLKGLYKDEQDSSDPKEFIQRLQSSDGSWQEERERSMKDHKALRFVAEISQEGISVGTKAVDKASPLGQLAGTDNLIQIRTRMYDSNPLVLTGPGAGAAVTAAGVLNDIMAIANSSGA